MMMTRNKFSIILYTLFITLLSLLFTPTVYALGELLVSPTRVIFDKRTRTASVSIVNAGNEVKTYRIEFVERRMTQDGGFEEIKRAKPGELFSSSMIRFSPRQVVLEPGQAQAIRLMLRKPAQLADGEYRSHLLFRAIPKASTRSVESLTGDKAISIKLTPIIGISIPVIVRHGQVSAEVKVDKLRYYAKTSSILFDLKRDGQTSVYGDITILFKNQSGQSNVLRKINGLAIYAPNIARRMNIQVQPQGGDLKNGTLTVLFHQTKEAGGGLITEHSVKIP